MLMCVLLKEEIESRRALLFKRLVNYDFNDVDFYLPQLVCLLLNWPYKSIIYLLLYFEFRCALSSRFAYKLHWTLRTFQNVDRMSDLFNYLGQHPRLFLKGSSSHKKRRTVSDSDYPEVSFTPSSLQKPIKNQNDFVSKLTSIESSMICLNYDHRLRARHLVTQLQDINRFLKGSLDAWNPLIDGYHRIVHIPVNDSFVLNSARRAPYILFMECVRTTAADSSNGRKGRRRRRFETRDPERKANSDMSCSSSEVDLTDALFNDDSFVVVPDIDDVDLLDDYDIVSYQEAIISRIAVQPEPDDLILSRGRTLNYGLSLPAIAFNVQWDERVQRISESSIHRRKRNPLSSDWFLSACMVKYCDDARHELLAYQFIRQLQLIWRNEKVPVYVHPVKTVLLNDNFALMQVIPGAISLHQIKCKYSGSLRNYMRGCYSCFLDAQKNFVASCAGYSIVCYLLQVKDRHNGNILLSRDGHLIHIDFGYILDSSPGSIGFEQAHFKMTPEYVEVMDGLDSDMFKYYKVLMTQALIAARKHRDTLLPVIQSYQKWTKLKCFSNKTVTERMEKRFAPNTKDDDVLKLIDGMVGSNMNALTTRVYDYYQYQSCGIR